MIVRAESADLVEPRCATPHFVGAVQHEAVLVEQAARATFGARAVVGEQQNECVVQDPLLFEEADEPADFAIGVREEAGERLHESRVHGALVGRECLPVLDPRRSRGQQRPRRHDAELELPREGPRAPILPAGVEAAAIALDPRARRLMRRVHRAGSEIQEERLPRRGVAQVLDAPNRRVDQILGQVVALLGRARRRDEPVVSHQLGGPLIGVTPVESVEVLEAHGERPALERAGRGLLPARRQVPLAHGERAVAGVAEYTRQCRGARRDARVVAGEAHRDVGEEAHAHRVVIAAGEQRRARGRAHRRDVEAVEAQAAGGEPVDHRRRDVGAEAAELGEAEVVEHDHDHVRRARRSTWIAGLDRG